MCTNTFHMDAKFGFDNYKGNPDNNYENKIENFELTGSGARQDRAYFPG